MKYQLCFVDATSDNDWNIAYEGELSNKDVAKLKKGIQERFSHKLSDVNVESFDGEWVDFSTCIAFEAEPSTLRDEVVKIVDEEPRIDVFSVIDDSDTTVFTEENL